MTHGDVDELTAYDGRSFRTIPSPEHRNKVYEVSPGVLWSVGAGTLDSVIWSLHGDKPRSISIYHEDHWTEVAKLAGTDFLPLSESVLLVIHEGSLSEFNANNKKTRILIRPKQASVGLLANVIRSGDGGVWVIAERGVIKIQPPTKGDASELVWTEHPIPETLNVSGLLRPIEGSQGELYAVARTEEAEKRVLVELDGDAWLIAHQPTESGDLIAGWREPDGGLWIIMGEDVFGGYANNWRLSHIAGNGKNVIPRTRVLTGILNGLVVEKDGSFCLATSNGLARRASLIWGRPDGGPEPDAGVYAMHQDSLGRMYFSREGCLEVRGEQNWTANSHVRLWGLRICSLASGPVIYGMNEGSLAVFDPETREFGKVALPGSELVKYYEDAGDGRAWMLVKSPDGDCRLVLYDGETIRTVIDSWDIQKVGGNYYSLRKLLQTKNGEIWFGSLTSLAVYKEGRLRSVEAVDGYKAGSSLCLLECEDGTIWAGGSEGIQAYDGKKWTLLESPGFDTVRSMIRTRDGLIWVGAGSGIHRYNGESWTSHAIEEGVPDAAVAQLLEDRNDVIWAATSGGVSRHLPIADANPPETFLESDKNPAEAPPDGEVHFIFGGRDKWEQSPEERLLYSCRMDGKEWSPFKERVDFSASGLSAGNHDFEVRAVDRNGNTDPTPAKHTFRVVLPWYKEPMFLFQAWACGLLLAASTGYGLTRHFRLEKLVVVRTAALTDTNQSLAREVAERTQAEERLKRLNIVLRSIRDVNQLITTERDRDRFLQGVCDIFVGTRGYGHCWITLLDDSGALSLTAEAGIDADFQRVSDTLKHRETLGCVQQALAASGVVASTNLGSHCVGCPLSELHRSGVTLTVRMEDENKVYGLISMLTSGRHGMDEDEQRLLQELAADIAFALGGMERDEERNRAEESLREGEERHRTILQTAMDGFWMVDMDGRLLEVNESYCLMSGYAENELLAMRISDLEAAETSGETGARIQRIMEHGQQRFESKHRRKDGSIVDVEVGAQRHPVESKRVIAFLRDISKNKRAEKERLELEEQIRQTQKMESVGRLAGGVAHDFNNMLAVILGNASMALQEIDPAHPVHVDLEEICKAANRSADLTRQLLAFARKQTVAPKVLDINDAIGGMLKMLGRLIGEDIDLVWTPGGRLGRIKMDPSQIDQVLANLCVNARDAIEDVGKITIETGNASFDAKYCAKHVDFTPGDYVQLSVSDNGHGMDCETLEHIFEPFYTTKDVGVGTGLGLATVFGIVKQNNGFINVYSEPGHGTTFKIYLPRHESEGDCVGSERSIEASVGGDETILLVEDEAILLKLNRRTLERFGYRVLAASTPEEALKLAKNHVGAIHLLMTDVVMPGMNGRDLARQVTLLCPSVKRLFVSGYTANVIAHHGVLDEGVHFLQKPFMPQVLAAKIREVLDEK